MALERMLADPINWRKSIRVSVESSSHKQLDLLS